MAYGSTFLTVLYRRCGLPQNAMGWKRASVKDFSDQVCQFASQSTRHQADLQDP